MNDRLPTHVEVGALLRQVQAQGGFATIIQKGERETGTVLLVLCENGRDSRAYERMPSLNGQQIWHRTKSEDIENKQDFAEYLARRAGQDQDLWIVELDIANAERLIGLNTDSA
jgi:hypothetical protein